MKIKRIKLTALFVCVILLLPMIFACGEKADTASSTTNAPSITEAQITDPPTDPPTEPPTDPPPTDPPTTWEPIDPNLPYWEQIEVEMSRYGLTGGTKCLPGEDEAAVMKGFGTGNSKKEELDLTGENVPFSAGYAVTVAKDTDNFWDASYTRALEKDLPVQQDDLVVGVIWIKGERLSETDSYAIEDAPEYYLAIKTSTDNWATEGGVEPSREQWVEPEWQKVYFYGYIMNEEEKSQSVQLQIFIGYGNQRLDIGGIIAYWFPYSRDNEAAALKLVDDFYPR
ncbi:MAG: hypothetical protein FWF92_06655 [Oscillospiraceae bacterium]|nr:hypothetical protein [Oscillospiraceae bacterium]